MLKVVRFLSFLPFFFLPLARKNVFVFLFARRFLLPFQCSEVLSRFRFARARRPETCSGLFQPSASFRALLLPLSVESATIRGCFFIQPLFSSPSFRPFSDARSFPASLRCFVGGGRFPFERGSVCRPRIFPYPAALSIKDVSFPFPFATAGVLRFPETIPVCCLRGLRFGRVVFILLIKNYS